MEVKTWTTGIRTYRIIGGARETTYDDLKQAIRRVKNLAKKGKKITSIWYNLDSNTYTIVVTDNLWEEKTTMGYQYAYYRTFDGKKYVGMVMRYKGHGYTVVCNGMIPF